MWGKWYVTVPVLFASLYSLFFGASILMSETGRTEYGIAAIVVGLVFLSIYILLTRKAKAKEFQRKKKKEQKEIQQVKQPNKQKGHRKKPR